MLPIFSENMLDTNRFTSRAIWLLRLVCQTETIRSRKLQPSDGIARSIGRGAGENPFLALLFTEPAPIDPECCMLGRTGAYRLQANSPLTVSFATCCQPNGSAKASGGSLKCWGLAVSCAGTVLKNGLILDVPGHHKQTIHQLLALPLNCEQRRQKETQTC